MLPPYLFASVTRGRKRWFCNKCEFIRPSITNGNGILQLILLPMHGRKYYCRLSLAKGCAIYIFFCCRVFESRNLTWGWVKINILLPVPLAKADVTRLCLCAALLMAVQFLLPTLTCYEKSGNFPRKTSVRKNTSYPLFIHHLGKYLKDLKFDDLL